MSLGKINKSLYMSRHRPSGVIMYEERDFRTYNHLICKDMCKGFRLDKSKLYRLIIFIVLRESRFPSTILFTGRCNNLFFVNHDFLTRSETRVRNQKQNIERKALDSLYGREYHSIITLQTFVEKMFYKSLFP